MEINDIYCPGCSEPIAASIGRGLPLWDRMRLRITEAAPPPGSKAVGPCWIWHGGKSGNHSASYGAAQVEGKVLKVHRVVYEMVRGQVPKGLVLDHLCQTRLCANPNHLEPVTQKENVRRRDMAEFVQPSYEPIDLPDLRAPLKSDKGPYVCCPSCQALVPGTPSAHLPLLDRIMLRVQKAPPPDGVAGDCWIWTGSSSERSGSNTGARYGEIMVNSVATKSHRAAYELIRGPIPEGLSLDHLCRQTLCCNPDHLEPVTHKENVLRGTSPAAKNAVKTHCKNGHEFTPENTYIRPDGAGRACRTCKLGRIQHKRDLTYLERGYVPHGVYGDQFLERMTREGNPAQEQD